MDSEKGMLDIRERLIKIETMLENQSKTSDLKLDTYSEKLKGCKSENFRHRGTI